MRPRTQMARKPNAASRTPSWLRTTAAARKIANPRREMDLPGTMRRAASPSQKTPQIADPACGTPPLLLRRLRLLPRRDDVAVSGRATDRPGRPVRLIGRLPRDWGARAGLAPVVRQVAEVIQREYVAIDEHAQ